MRRALSVMLVLLSSACGGAAKKPIDTILGRKEKATPFRVDLAQLKGLYVTTRAKDLRPNGSSSRFGDLPIEVAEVWKIEGTTLDAYRPGAAAQRCGERAISVEGDATLLLAATASCQEERVVVLDQSGDYSFVVMHDSFKIGEDSFNAVGFDAERSRVSLASELYDWNTDFKDAPSWLASALPKEAAVDAMTAARAAFKDALTGAHLVLEGDHRADRFHEVARYDPYPLFIIENGKFRHSLVDLDARTDEELRCVLLVEAAKMDAYADGFDEPLAEVTVHHSRHTDGMWRLADGSLSVNAKRANKLEAKLAGATLTCSKKEGTSVITIEDVKKTLGALVQLKK